MEIDEVRRRFAADVEKRRLAAGKTRQDIEREAGIAAGIVGRIEREKSLPSIETLLGLAVGLHCAFVVSATKGIEMIEEMT